MSEQTLLSPDVDFLFFVHFCILISISFLMMTFANGESTIQYINPYLAQNGSSVLPTLFSENRSGFNAQAVQLQDNKEYLLGIEARNIGQLMEYKTRLIKQQFKIPLVMLFLYWVMIPLVNLLYVIYSFRKPKSLNTPIPLESRGVLNDTNV